MFKFDGRLRRSHFWISWVILFFGGLILGLIPILGSLISLAAIWPQIAIQVKRLHDMGLSGWWVLAQIAANIVLMIIAFVSMMGNFMANADALESEDPAALMALFGSIGFVVLLFFVVNIGWLLWIGIVDSKPGRNIYGPNPKNPVDDTQNAAAGCAGEGIALAVVAADEAVAGQGIGADDFAAHRCLAGLDMNECAGQTAGAVKRRGWRSRERRRREPGRARSCAFARAAG
jgi:uncharacterized membrane protein YhaH (DUF805 family)